MQRPTNRIVEKLKNHSICKTKTLSEMWNEEMPKNWN